MTQDEATAVPFRRRAGGYRRKPLIAGHLRAMSSRRRPEQTIARTYLAVGSLTKSYLYV